jgi:hypothetical protein
MQHAISTVEGRRAVWLAPEVELEIVGESFYTEHIERLVDEGKLGARAQLVAWLSPEYDNPHDANSVMVWLCGGKVGHLARPVAKVWHPALIELNRYYQAPVACLAEIRGFESFGVFLRVPHDAPAPPAPDFVITGSVSSSYAETVALAASYRGIWGNQTELGSPLGLSSIAVGRQLIKLGLRDATTKEPTPRAKADELVIFEELHTRWLWSLAKVRPLLTADAPPKS